REGRCDSHLPTGRTNRCGRRHRLTKGAGMKCLGRTASGARCRRERAPRRLTCEEHSLWKTFWKGVLALSVVVSLLGGAVALADRFGLFTTPAPTTADECLEQSDSSTARELMIAGWL